MMQKPLNIFLGFISILLLAGCSRPTVVSETTNQTPTLAQTASALENEPGDAETAVYLPTIVSESSAGSSTSSTPGRQPATTLAAAGSAAPHQVNRTLDKTGTMKD